MAKDAADLLRRLENPTAGQRGSVGESAPPAREAEVAAAIRSRDLAALARLWVLGAQVPWRELHRDGRRRVSLPGYTGGRRQTSWLRAMAGLQDPILCFATSRAFSNSDT